jgi:hypothetical protein
MLDVAVGRFQPVPIAAPMVAGPLSRLTRGP